MIFFIFIIIVIVSLGQLFFLKYPQSDNLYVTFAQSTNATSIFVPSNMNRLEVTLLNDSNGSDFSLIIQIITAIVSAAAAIAGGFLASRYSFKQALATEKFRYDNERKKQKEDEEKQEKQKEEYRNKVIETAYYELADFSFTLKNIQDKKYYGVDEKYTLKILESRFENYNMDFLTIPFEVRLSLLTPGVLWNVNSGYSFFLAFKKALLPFIEDYSKHPTGQFHEEIKHLGPLGVKEIVDVAIKDLKKLLHK